LQRWIDIFNTLITIIDTQEIVDFPRDPKDAKFIACALATRVEFIITGDKDFTGAYKIWNTTVISVSMFKKLVCAMWDVLT